MTLQDLLPPSGIPPTGFPTSRDEYWFGQDSAEDYRRNGGHPLFGEQDIVYRFNGLGYRSAEFDVRPSVPVLAIGCSWVMGVGVPEEAIFHQLFTRRLESELGAPAVAWNLGIAGASNDAMVRLLHQALPVLRPAVVLLLFTHLGRREYIAAHNAYVRYSPRVKPTDPVGREIAGHFAALGNTYDDRLNLFRNYQSAAAVLRSTEWYFSFVNPDEASLLRGHIDPERQAARHTWLDVARDRAHPGPATHRNLYEAFWATFVKNGGLSSVRQHLCPPTPLERTEIRAD
jgi:hypothetical protein